MVCRKRLAFAYFYIIFLQDIVSCTQCLEGTYQDENEGQDMNLVGWH
jgi:hypothetical protein